MKAARSSARGRAPMGTFSRARDRFFSSQPIASEHVTLLDGSGAEFDAEIARCGRSEVDLRVLERREIDRELAFELVIGVSLPKGDRQKWLVEKLTGRGGTG